MVLAIRKGVRSRSHDSNLTAYSSEAHWVLSGVVLGSLMMPDVSDLVAISSFSLARMVDETDKGEVRESLDVLLCSVPAQKNQLW